MPGVCNYRYVLLSHPGNIIMRNETTTAVLQTSNYIEKPLRIHCTKSLAMGVDEGMCVVGMCVCVGGGGGGGERGWAAGMAGMA